MIYNFIASFIGCLIGCIIGDKIADKTLNQNQKGGCYCEQHQTAIRRDRDGNE